MKLPKPNLIWLMKLPPNNYHEPPYTRSNPRAKAYLWPHANRGRSADLVQPKRMGKMGGRTTQNAPGVLVCFADKIRSKITPSVDYITQVIIPRRVR